MCMCKECKSKIQTGRTTRMLALAEKLAVQGRAVYVIADGWRQARWLQKVFGVEKSKRLGVKFETVSAVRFDWESLRVEGSHPNCAFLVDHYAIEARFGNVLSMLHMFDVDPQRP